MLVFWILKISATPYLKTMKTENSACVFHTAVVHEDAVVAERAVHLPDQNLDYRLKQNLW